MYHTLAYSYMLNPLIQYNCKQTTQAQSAERMYYEKVLLCPEQ